MHLLFQCCYLETFNFLGGIGRFSIKTNIIYAIGSMLGIALAGIAIIYFYNGKTNE